MKRFPWRSILYAVILLYLFIDLRMCKGPLRKKIDERHTSSIEAAIANKWVAIVNQEPITSQQLDFALFRYLHQRGKADDELPESTTKMMRRAVLQTVINDTLVRQYADGEKFQASPSEIEEFVADWKSQFSSEEDLQERLTLQGLSEEQCDAELARIWSRKEWLQRRIEPGVSVTEEELRDWYERNKKGGQGLHEPEKVRVRHIFLSTVEKDDESREQKIREVWGKLVDESNPTDFAELAKEVSEDPRSKNRGGDLNWLSRERVPDDFSTVVFSLSVGEVSEPFRTSIGWHIAEVMEKQDARPRKYEEARDEIRALLVAEHRRETIASLMKKLRTVAKIQLFPENI